jgi:hypothetical protein
MVKFISLGLQCIVPQGIILAKHHEYDYPLDWNFSPSKTTYNILYHLLHHGVDSAFEYMTTGNSCFRNIGRGRFAFFNEPSTTFTNIDTGLTIVNFTMVDDCIDTLKKQLIKFRSDITSLHRIIFIYSDAVNPASNYHINDIEYGVDATEYLIKIYHLVFPFNNNIKILYFCWNERHGKPCHEIEYIPFDNKTYLSEVSEIIRNHIRRMDY